MHHYSRKSVFISATTKGFGQWRSWIIDILREHDIDPLEQRRLTPESKIVRTEIEALISGASGVICLVGPYFGYPMDPPNSDGKQRLSYTQHEWMIATQWNKPRKVYLIEKEFFGAEGCESEEVPEVSDSRYFSQWQREFQEMIRSDNTRHPQKHIKSPEELGVSLAMINWNIWPNE